jgi:hypothetical protein
MNQNHRFLGKGFMQKYYLPEKEDRHLVKNCVTCMNDDYDDTVPVQQKY